MGGKKIIIANDFPPASIAHSPAVTLALEICALTK